MPISGGYLAAQADPDEKPEWKLECLQKMNQIERWNAADCGPDDMTATCGSFGQCHPLGIQVETSPSTLPSGSLSPSGCVARKMRSRNTKVKKKGKVCDYLFSPILLIAKAHDPRAHNTCVTRTFADSTSSTL